MYRNKTVGYTASILFLFIPLVFYYARLAYLDMGGAFFITLSFYYFLKFKKSGASLDLYWNSLWGGVGFLYRRTVLMAVILIAFFYFLEVLKDKDKKRFWIGVKAYSISAILILPWFILCNLFSTKYPCDLTNWLSLSKMCYQFFKIPNHATVLVFLLFVAAALYGIIRKRDCLTMVCMGWYIGWYIFISGMRAYFVDRFMVVIYVPISIIIAQFIDDNLRHPFIKYAIISFIGAYLAMNCILIPTQLVSPEYCVQTDSEIGYLPYDEAFRYVAKNLPPESKIVSTMVCEPSHFYAYLNGIDMNRIYRRNWVSGIEQDKGFKEPNWSSENQSIDNLYQFCIESGYDYVMFPKGKRWLLWSVNERLVESLDKEEDSRFILIKKFKRGKNEIILARVRKGAA
ncbi:MAG: glycosyltransferase family 39 protein [Candidatus Omnitrophica bacterium]|nr:glycosyltransferase family 39 protein [Candidatus Omnitrophota bacterium]